MAMHNPPHPGDIVKRQCLEPLGLTVTRAAEGLGVTRQALSELVNPIRHLLHHVGSAAPGQPDRNDSVRACRSGLPVTCPPTGAGRS